MGLFGPRGMNNLATYVFRRSWCWLRRGTGTGVYERGDWVWATSRAGHWRLCTSDSKSCTQRPMEEHRERRGSLFCTFAFAFFQPQYAICALARENVHAAYHTPA